MNLTIIDLFNRYINGQCTSEELDEVFSILSYGKYPDEWEAAITMDVSFISNSDQQSNLTQNDVNRIYEGIENNLVVLTDAKPGTKRKKSISLWQISSAAAILIIGAVLFYFYRAQTSSKQNMNIYTASIHPGGNKAFLTLSNGKKISLTDAAIGTLANQSGISLTKKADGQLVYIVKSSGENLGSSQSNTIETPKGGQYQVLLHDGTAVWLNAASSLTYPLNFDKLKERRVKLSGEAYFEVAKDKAHPFVVSTSMQEIKVLGTHFNVKGYKDESVISTTLLEGSVKVTNLSSEKTRLLRPGQQANLFKNGEMINVVKVVPQNIISWKNGYFIFDNQDVVSVMQVISRWYDVDVEYKSIDKADRFGGTFSRSTNLADLLKVLELLGKTHFKIEGKRIIVSN